DPAVRQPELGAAAARGVADPRQRRARPAIRARTMRRIAANFQVSVDGVVEAPETWAAAHFSEEMLEVARAGMQDTDTLLLGRRTYEEFAAFWPTQDPSADPFAGFLNQT